MYITRDINVSHNMLLVWGKSAPPYTWGVPTEISVVTFLLFAPIEFTYISNL